MPQVAEDMPGAVGKCDAAKCEELPLGELPRFVQKEKVHRFVYLSPNWFTQITLSSSLMSSNGSIVRQPCIDHVRRNSAWRS